MQSTGIIRRIDELGRFVIPKEMRRYLGLEGDAAQLEIYLENDSIILKKYDDAGGKYICPECLNKLKKL